MQYLGNKFVYNCYLYDIEIASIAAVRLWKDVGTNQFYGRRIEEQVRILVGDEPKKIIENLVEKVIKSLHDSGAIQTIPSENKPPDMKMIDHLFVFPRIPGTKAE